MTNLELAKQQGNQAAPNIIDAAKASEVQIDITLAQEQGNQATPLIADSLAGSESYEAIKQQGNQAMPLIVDVLERPVPPTVSPMYFEAVEANSTVTMTSTLATAPNLEYSTDGSTWQEWQHTTVEDTHTFDTITLGAIGDRVYLRGDNPNGLGTSSQNFSNFTLTGAVNGGGNIMSMLDADMELTEVPEFGFFALFANFSGQESALITPPKMDTITAIGVKGCDSMFFSHTTLTNAADMPSVVTIGIKGCFEMYYQCTSLAAAADTPALVTIGDIGCAEMYCGCSALTAAANMPALTTIGDSGCGAMYSECSLLTAAADMPALAIIGDNGCNNLYSNCTFNMSDDGTTLNFDFPTPPVTAGETTFSTALDVAMWMGNTNGFII